MCSFSRNCAYVVQICLGGPDIDHPDNRDDNPTMKYNSRTSQFIGEHFKGISTTSSVYEACISTVRHIRSSFSFQP